MRDLNLNLPMENSTTDSYFDALDKAHDMNLGLLVICDPTLTSIPRLSCFMSLRRLEIDPVIAVQLH